MAPLLAHGVDISKLEGWLIKLHNHPSAFNKGSARRWFRVSMEPSHMEQKLVLTYFSSKAAKEPSGWIYLDDVVDVSCRHDLIELVSTSRTFRFRGETNAEHRLWADSLYKLCSESRAMSSNKQSKSKADHSAPHAREDKAVPEDSARLSRSRDSTRDESKEAPARHHLESSSDQSSSDDESYNHQDKSKDVYSQMDDAKHSVSRQQDRSKENRRHEARSESEKDSSDEFSDEMEQANYPTSKKSSLVAMIKSSAPTASGNTFDLGDDDASSDEDDERSPRRRDKPEQITPREDKEADSYVSESKATKSSASYKHGNDRTSSASKAPGKSGRSESELPRFDNNFVLDDFE